MYRSQQPGSLQFAVGESVIMPDKHETVSTDKVFHKKLSLRINISWTLFGNAVYAGCQWAMLVILAKLVSPALVGRFALGLAVTAPLIAFANLQLRLVQATDATSQYLFSDYLALRLIALAGVLIIAVSIAFGCYSPAVGFVIIAIALAKTFESISDVFYGLLQQHERMDLISISKTIKGILSLIALGLAVYVTHSILWGSVALAGTWAIILLTVDIRYGSKVLNSSSGEANSSLRPRWHMETIRRLAMLALPLGFAGLLNSMQPNVPRYFVEQCLGERALGFFAAIAYIMVAVTMVIYAVGESAAPKLGQYYAENKPGAFRALLVRLLAFGAGIGICGILVALVAGKPLLSCMYKPEYARHADIFVLIMIAAGFISVAAFLNYAMTATRSITVQMPLFAVVTGATALSSYLLIPLYGLRGAAVSLIIGAVTQSVFSFIVVHRTLKSMSGGRNK